MKDSCGQEIKIKRGDVVLVELKTVGQKLIWILDVCPDAIDQYINLLSTDTFSECTQKIPFDDIREFKCLDNVHTRILGDPVRVQDIFEWYNRLKKYEAYVG